MKNKTKEVFRVLIKLCDKEIERLSWAATNGVTIGTHTLREAEEALIEINRIEIAKEHTIKLKRMSTIIEGIEDLGGDAVNE